MSDDNKSSVTICIRMSETERDRLVAMAKQDHRTLSSYIRLILSTHAEKPAS